MVLFLNENYIERLLTMTMAIEAVENAFVQLGKGLAENLPRRRLHAPKGMLHMMGATLPNAGFMGYKAYTVFPGKIKFRIFLHRSETGELLAVMEADRLGQIRTGCSQRRGHSLDGPRGFQRGRNTWKWVAGPHPSRGSLSGEVGKSDPGFQSLL